ncbi:iron complex transport system ATP-binding protein [Ureibacillus xyleni]|uniref:Iron complex transport system ATP-binding protein n=1 Tax=Ureibacillus xyleni TaxID=614648 RepID=A0A285SSL0_9BACL|nr:ATP-binding cassette domain-containing protein [Ureibacillus xyleni]SOC11423.1 iron complex transport system ATP-binding protein [Ureibacillus xyleni]
MIKIENLVGGYTNSPILTDVNLEIHRGEFFALLGPNGSGKTTLFKMITGQLPIQSGNILLSGKEISSYSKLEKAKKVAVLTQEIQVSFDYTVEEIISLGRYPHQKGMLKSLSKEDHYIIEEVMDITKISNFRKTQFRKLSGGEKQRVLLAKALAQEPELLLLDEPTNHLDIKHTFQLLDLLKERQLSKGLTIFSILHDLNVASLYADRFALLHNGTFIEVGDVELLRKEEQLQKVYQVKVNAQSHPTVPKPQLLMTPNYTKIKDKINFTDSYEMTQYENLTHIQFAEPLRTISNGAFGDGIQWLKHFCIASDENLLKKYGIPYEQVGCMASTDNIMVTQNSHMMAVVGEEKGSFNILLFIDGHFSDGELVNGFMALTEGKMQALKNLSMNSTDTQLLAATQQGRKVSAGEIREFVFNVTTEAISRYLQMI